MRDARTRHACVRVHTHTHKACVSSTSQGMEGSFLGGDILPSPNQTYSFSLHLATCIDALTSHVCLLGRRLPLWSLLFCSINRSDMATHNKVSSCSFWAAACAARLYFCSRAILACSGPQIRRRQCSVLSAGAAAPSPAWLCCKPAMRCAACNADMLLSCACAFALSGHSTWAFKTGLQTH